MSISSHIIAFIGGSPYSSGSKHEETDCRNGLALDQPSGINIASSVGLLGVNLCLTSRGPKPDRITGLSEFDACIARWGMALLFEAC